MGIPVGRFESDPLEPLTLPRGVNGSPPRTLPARNFTLGMGKLAARADDGDEEAARELLRRCLDGITDDELDDLEPGEARWIVAYCARTLPPPAAPAEPATPDAADAAPAAPDVPAPAAPAPTPTTTAPPAGAKRRRRRAAAE